MTKQAIDLEFLRSVIDDDNEFKKELFEIFEENTLRNIAKMEEAIRNLDNNMWYMASHAFKGASASIGAFDLSKSLEFAQKIPEASAQEKEECLKNVKKELALVLEFIKGDLAS